MELVNGKVIEDKTFDEIKGHVNNELPDVVKLKK